MCLCLGIHPSPENEFRSTSRKADILIALWRKSSRKRDIRFFPEQGSLTEKRVSFRVDWTKPSSFSSMSSMWLSVRFHRSRTRGLVKRRQNLWYVVMLLSPKTQHANFLSMSQMRKNRPWKFQKQPNTIGTMCLERGIHTPHRKRVSPETRCTYWFRCRTVAGQTTKQRDANTSATTRLLVGEACDQHALCNKTINLGCWMVLIVIFDRSLVTLDATSLTVLDFAYTCPSQDVHLSLAESLDLCGSCHLHVNLVLSSPFQFH